MNDKFNAVPTRETNVKYSALLRIVGMVTSVVVFGSAQAQENPAKNYPDKPIHVILGYAAGGANDLVARVFGSKLNEALGQPVLVESKTGAAGMIAVNYVAKTKPDGYTLLFAASSMFTTNPVMFRNVGYSLSDFTPISTVVTFPFLLIVSASQPIQSLKELVERLKAKPEGANASGAAGVHQLAFELFKSQTGTSGEYIPYRSTTESLNAVASDDVLMTIADAAAASVMLRSGRVRGPGRDHPKAAGVLP